MPCGAVRGGSILAPGDVGPSPSLPRRWVTLSASSRERSRRGLLGEHLAARFLELDGATILARRVRFASVEIDLLVRDADCLVVVEVKLRTGSVQRAVDALRPQQAQRLRRAATFLLQQHAWADAVRIDVVALDWQAAHGSLHMRRLRGVDTP